MVIIQTVAVGRAIDNEPLADVSHDSGVHPSRQCQKILVVAAAIQTESVCESMQSVQPRYVGNPYNPDSSGRRSKAF